MTEDHIILSLDLGTQTGWALVKNGVVKYSGEVHLPDSKSHPGHRYVNFSNWLSQYRGVNEIVYEDVPRFMSNKSARVYCGLLCIAQMFSLTHGIALTNIKATSVKMDFADNGHAKKDEMCAIAHSLGWKGGKPGTEISHNECDAIAAAWVIMQRRGITMTIDQ